MTSQTLPSRLFVDTNFLLSCLFAVDRFHRDARSYLYILTHATRSGQTEAFTSPRVIEEALWMACRTLYEMDHGSGTFGVLPQDERFNMQVEYQDGLSEMSERLVSDGAPHTIVPMLTKDIAVAVDFATVYGIPLTDAFHCALAVRVAGGNIITNDRHMKRIPEIDCLPYIAPR